MRLLVELFLIVGLISYTAYSKLNAVYLFGGLNTSYSNTLRQSNFTHFYYSFVVICYKQAPANATDCVDGNPGDPVYVTFNLQNPYSTSMASFWANYAIIRSIKQVLFSIGGWGDPWQVVQQNPEASAQAVGKFVLYHKLSGIDLDYEGNGQLTMENFGLFTKYLRQYMPQGSLLTIVPVAVRNSSIGGGLQRQYEAMQSQGVTPDFILLQFYEGGWVKEDPFDYLLNNLTNTSLTPHFNISMLVSGFEADTPHYNVKDVNCVSEDGYSECFKIACQIQNQWNDNGGVFTWDLGILMKAGDTSVRWDTTMAEILQGNTDICKQYVENVEVKPKEFLKE